MLGAQVRAARKARNWSLADMADILKEAGAPEVQPGTLARMEDGSRPGSPEVWGKMWQVLRLPLRDLYEGLGLPVPTELPSGTAGEIMETIHGMPEESRRLVLSFARHAPGMLEAAGVYPLSLVSAMPRAAEPREAYNP